ncbi:hypothetical protein ACWGK7_03450 [Sphingomonas aurantiaca]
MALDVIAGGDGTPPEPNWNAIFGRVGDRNAAAGHWKSIVAEVRSAEKLAAANGHAILRLVVAYMAFDRSAKEVMKSGPVASKASARTARTKSRRRPSREGWASERSPRRASSNCRP